MDEINYLSLNNNAKIISCSSQAKSCGASNVLSNDRKVYLEFESRQYGLVKLVFLNI